MCAQCACECAVHPFSLLTFSSFGALGFLLSRTLPLPLEGKTHSKNSEEKDRGLAALVGVGRCHEMGIGEDLISRLTLEAPLGAFLLLLFRSQIFS